MVGVLVLADSPDIVGSDGGHGMHRPGDLDVALLPGTDRESVVATLSGNGGQAAAVRITGALHWLPRGPVTLWAICVRAGTSSEPTPHTSALLMVCTPERSVNMAPGDVEYEVSCHGSPPAECAMSVGPGKVALVLMRVLLVGNRTVTLSLNNPDTVLFGWPKNPAQG